MTTGCLSNTLNDMPTGYRYVLDVHPYDHVPCTTIEQWAKELATGLADPSIPRRYTAARLAEHYSGLCPCKEKS